MSVALRGARSGCSRKRTSLWSTHKGTAAARSSPSTGRELERRADRLADAEAGELRAAARAIRTLCAEHERLERACGP